MLYDDQQWANEPQWQPHFQQPQYAQSTEPKLKEMETLAELVQSMAHDVVRAQQEIEEFKMEVRVALNFLNDQMLNVVACMEKVKISNSRTIMPTKVDFESHSAPNGKPEADREEEKIEEEPVPKYVKPIPPEIRHPFPGRLAMHRKEEGWAKTKEANLPLSSTICHLPTSETTVPIDAELESHHAQNGESKADHEEEGQKESSNATPELLCPETPKLKLPETEAIFPTRPLIRLDQIEEFVQRVHQDAARCKERKKKVHDKFILAMILRLSKPHDQAIRVKIFEHGRKILLYDQD